MQLGCMGGTTRSRRVPSVARVFCAVAICRKASTPDVTPLARDQLRTSSSVNSFVAIETMTTITLFTVGEPIWRS